MGDFDDAEMKIVDASLAALEKDGSLDGLKDSNTIIGVFSSWLKMKDRRPDLVASAYARVLDAEKKKLITKKEAVALLAENFDNITEVATGELSYLFMHIRLYDLLKSGLEIESFDQMAAALIRQKDKVFNVEKREFLDRIEQTLIAHGYKNKFYKFLNLPNGPKNSAARKWELLRSEKMDEVEEGYGTAFIEAMLTQRSFGAQLSHHVVQWRESLNTKQLIELLDEDPFLSSYHGVQIQKAIYSLVDPNHLSSLPALEPDFSTRLALKNINRIFMLQKIEHVRGKNLEAFFAYFEDPTAPRLRDPDFMTRISIEWAPFVHLAFAWERVIEWNLSSKSEWAVSEAQLLQQAKGVPEFIFRFVYQETRSRSVRNFLEKLEELR